VLARVCYGFIGNRMMEGYAREAQRVVLEGATPREVDSALEAWGMAMGILAVFDMAGIDVGVNVHKANASRYPPDPSYYQADAALYEAGRLGQKNGKGYYRYEPGNRTRFDDPEAVDILRRRAQELRVAPRAHSVVEIQERAVFALMNEGFRVLGEGIALRAADIDVVWTSGYGFPRYRGGPMFHAQTLGLSTLLDGLRRYRDLFGPMHWEPAPLLVELVDREISIAEWERRTG
jgi:3-hydroxyacyl-CoA dehydrogenase